MQDFIKMATDQLGLSESNARSATGGLLGLLQQHGDKQDSQELIDKLPGASDLLKQGGGGGLLGGLAGGLGSAIGGNVGGALGIAGALKGLGLDTDKLGPFISLFFSFAKQKAGADLIGRLLGKIPELAKLAG